MKLVYKCRECGSPFVTEKGLSEHLAFSHQIQPKEYYDKYYGVNAQIGNEVSADWQKREKDAQKTADIARSLNFVY